MTNRAKAEREFHKTIGVFYCNKRNFSQKERHKLNTFYNEWNKLSTEDLHQESEAWMIAATNILNEINNK